ncbi:glycosyltransferase [Hymenobacter sp. BT683]|uniref:Glycosyltransferase n=1 Tax=Hymenobacter jeongseonensis TaxID=2791027 RepID=A0ABS0ICS8_9BACT|nr:glycosyltransferase [Hymenobacter jeongseonensis]MBF9236156.1 glycosyltransferase [Hymenobacter jeongseonensis]
MLAAGIFFGLFFVVCLGLLVLLSRRQRPRRRGVRAPRPRVSILVAARNEQASIERCLRSLAQQKYPTGRLEIIIADDHSTDATAAVIEEFIRDKPQFRLLRVRERLGCTKDKSNALAHLCRAATTNYLLFTDADMALPPDWVATMLAALEPGVGVVTGITTAEGNLFGRLQGLDWLFGLNVIRVLAERGLPTSAIGNNMLLTRAAYESIGGLENMRFSVSEDLQIFQKVVARGWGFRHLCEPQALGISEAQPNFSALLKQRKRWLKSASGLPWYLTGLFGMYATFYTVLCWPGLFPLSIITGIYLAKTGFQTLFLAITLRQTGRREHVAVLLLYELYLCIMSVAVLAYTLWPTRLEWKERRYTLAEA